MKKKLYYTIIGIIIMWVMSGCRKFLQVDPPTNQLVTQSVFSTSGSATAAVTSIYTKMQSDSYGMSQACGLLSDELNVGLGGSSLLAQYYTNAMDIYNYAGPWSGAYNYIYQANAIIEQLQQSPISSAAIRDQLTGEVKFIRAFWLFYLVNCYGDIPLTISTDYSVNSGLRRSTVIKVYEQIILDLTDAKEKLNSDYVDATDTVKTTNRVRPTKWAASALLARAYLYNGEFANAEKAATEVISNATFSLKDSLNDVFLANSTEAIWQLAVPLPTNINTVDGNSFILIAAPASNGSNSNACFLSQHLLDSFEVGDKRRDKWIGVYTTTDIPSVSYYFPYKYKVFESTDVTEYTMMLRLAEQYLIRAEARAQQGIDMQGAADDLNKIRVRAGLSTYGGGLDKTSLLTAILHERKFEFFCEWGHRWFDLIRMNKINDVMSVVGPDKGAGWHSSSQLFPIPQAERMIDFNLTQNPGY